MHYCLGVVSSRRRSNFQNRIIIKYPKIKGHTRKLVHKQHYKKNKIYKNTFGKGEISTILHPSQVN
jgi:hypothetical protein